MTQKIIVPTDFSDNALTATRYACELASQNNYTIHLFHCYTSNSALFDEEKANKDTNIPLLKADMLILDLKENLQKEYPSVSFETTCTSGLLYEVLPSVAVAPAYAMIVMGTTGTGKGKSVVWGSNTSSITTKAKVPVIAVPSTTKEFSAQKVGMLTNFKAEELDTLKAYLRLVSPIPHLDTIHVYRDSKDASEIAEHLDTWSFNIKNLNGIEEVQRIAEPIHIEDENLDSIPEVINHIIKENNYDMMVVTKTRKSFFERLFSPSVSKEIVLDLERPTFFDNN
ncbi:MAG: universal stress protein [Sphingobacterium sp.]|jgi:nucleotide-binding universal stress UspA family protein|nr:universal stress protein [Sphingobacterium sp.]